MEPDAWNSHQWSTIRCPLALTSSPAKVLQYHCSRCRRDFVEDELSGERYAVYVSVFSLRRIPDSIAKQWLRELCPGAPPAYDIEVRGKLSNNAHRALAPPHPR